MKYLLFFLLLLFTSCSLVTNGTTELKRYYVKKGNSDFLPNPTGGISDIASWQGSIKLDSSCWYNNLGEDNYDFNKICGFYNAFDFPFKTKNSVIVAWRPHKIKGRFEICIYENYSLNGSNNHPHEDAIVEVIQNQLFNFSFLLREGRYVFTLNDRIVCTQGNPMNYRKTIPISAWFGGTSKAPRDMSLYYVMQKIN